MIMADGSLRLALPMLIENSERVAVSEAHTAKLTKGDDGDKDSEEDRSNET